MKQFCFLFWAIFLLISCNSSTENQSEPTEKQDSIIQRKPKGELFKEDSLSFDAQKEKVFRPILNAEQRSEADLLLKKFREAYRIPLESGLELNKVYSIKMYGCPDSVWVMECIVPKDSLCAPHGRKQQIYFDAKGHLIHTDKAANIRWVNFMNGKGSLLMTLNTDCNGSGYHHFYKFDEGELLDIFNVLLENTPMTFDANSSDNVDLKPAELELKMEDKNGDKIKDIVFKGLKQHYKNGNFVKAQPIEYIFIYQPGEDWFLLKSLAK